MDAGPETPFEPQPDEAERSSWELEEEDEIVPGRTALQKLGGGHDFEAYLAWDDHLAFLVVAKMLRPHLADDERARKALRREASALEGLAHPCIVRFFGADLEGARPHVVMEHIEGPHLARLIRKFGPLPLEQLVPLGINLAAAIHYMAAEGMVHLDLKPRNVVVGSPPKLIDLSLARTMEQAGQIKGPIGTDLYMAPEQCAPDEMGPLTPAVDVWGLGVTLYQALSGGRAFERAADADLDDPKERFPQLTRPAPPLRSDAPSVLIETIQGCLGFEPKDRPEPLEVAEALGPVLTDLPARPVLRKLRPRLR